MPSANQELVVDVGQVDKAEINIKEMCAVESDVIGVYHRELDC